MISDRIKILLNELCLSQRQFAMRIDLDPGYFSRIVRGKVVPPKRILLLIENVFHVNKDWLENGIGPIFISQGISQEKQHVLDLIETLSPQQIEAVASFLKYLKENSN